MHPLIYRLLRNLQEKTLVSVRTEVAAEVIENDPEHVAPNRIKNNLVATLGIFIADNKIMDQPNVLKINRRVDRDTVQFDVSFYVLTVPEMERLLNEAFEAGRYVGQT